MGQMACRSVVVPTNVMGAHRVGMFCNKLCTPLSAAPTVIVARPPAEIDPR